MTDDKEIHDEPMEVLGEDGNVSLAGPDGTRVVLSPEAAEETSDRLWKWAMRVRRAKRQASSAAEPKG